MNRAAALWASFAVVGFSLTDVLVKFLSGDFPLYQLIFLRSVVALVTILCILVPLTGTVAMLKTKRLKQHLLRGGCVVIANFCFFLSLATLPLADAVAIFFVSPLLIAVLSVVMLGETVGPRRWAAIGIGFLGVLIVMRPGTSAFQIAALLPIVAAAAYAMLHVLTRRMGGTENATQMAFYIQIAFVIFSGVAGLALGHGGFDRFDDPSAQFLFRPWVLPGMRDGILMVALGVISAGSGFAISQAYRLAEAAFVAPFEYIALPMSVAWGLTLFDEVPDSIALVGIALIMVSGLVLIWREAIAARKVTPTQEQDRPVIVSRRLGP